MIAGKHFVKAPANAQGIIGVWVDFQSKVLWSFIKDCKPPQTVRLTYMITK